MLHTTSSNDIFPCSQFLRIFFGKLTRTSKDAPYPPLLSSASLLPFPPMSTLPLLSLLLLHLFCFPSPLRPCLLFFSSLPYPFPFPHSLSLCDATDRCELYSDLDLQIVSPRKCLPSQRARGGRFSCCCVYMYRVSPKKDFILFGSRFVCR